MGATTNPYGTTRSLYRAHPDRRLRRRPHPERSPAGGTSTPSAPTSPRSSTGEDPNGIPNNLMPSTGQGGCGQAGEGPRLWQRLPHPGRHRRAGLHPCGRPGPGPCLRHPQAGELGPAACSSATWAPARVTACWRCCTPLKGLRPRAALRHRGLAAPATLPHATPTPPRPRTSWAGWPSTALRDVRRQLALAEPEPGRLPHRTVISPGQSKQPPSRSQEQDGGCFFSFRCGPA